MMVYLEMKEMEKIPILLSREHKELIGSLPRYRPQDGV
jgi:hypothetical protein